jgi:hypothetical protein
MHPDALALVALALPHVDADSKRGVRDGQPLTQATGPLTQMRTGGNEVGLARGCPPATPGSLSSAFLCLLFNQLDPLRSVLADEPQHHSSLAQKFLLLARLVSWLRR